MPHFSIHCPVRGTRRRGKTVLFVLLCILAGLAVMLLAWLLGPGSDGPSASHAWVGMPVPAAELEAMINAEQAIDTSDLSGKVSLINIWGPWCGPCLMEFPELLEIRQRFADDPDFQLIAIAADGRWMPGQIQPFEEGVEGLKHDSQMVLAQYNSDLPVYLDRTAKLRSELVKSSPQFGYPTNFLVGRDGQIKAVWIGYSGDLSEMSKKIREELESTEGSDN
ncbi:TlpA family protein disulfide reductase [Bremerella sp. T1]|uniref:TlpA family protein disulfide reductase n=1 Tax=Bremerella sp. TYQ1 TaxID=3119568 RepID=UPI001CCF5D46|nr:TlpA family protein disulfide reductase [Bremerella volcania]UBM37965.1 TlpA family protein disulfide reductase [Bremerella volcania]